MINPLSNNIEYSEAVTVDNKLYVQQGKLALFSRIALKIIIGVVGLLIGSAVGFILALTFGFIDFEC